MPGASTGEGETSREDQHGPLTKGNSKLQDHWLGSCSLQCVQKLSSTWEYSFHQTPRQPARCRVDVYIHTQRKGEKNRDLHRPFVSAKSTTFRHLHFQVAGFDVVKQLDYSTYPATVNVATNPRNLFTQYWGETRDGTAAFLTKSFTPLQGT